MIDGISLTKIDTLSTSEYNTHFVEGVGVNVYKCTCISRTANLRKDGALE